MAKKFTKVMSLLLAMVMVFSMLGVTAMAYENQVGDYLAYDDAGNPGGYIKDSFKSIEGGKVTLSKTIKQTGENAFDITLQVTTTEDLEVIKKARDAAIVIVMDVSGSMQFDMSGGGYCTKCGKYKTDAYSICSANGVICDRTGWSNTWAQHDSLTALDVTPEHGDTRFALMENAVSAFLKDFADETGTAKRMVSMVCYNDKVEKELAWVNVTEADGMDAAQAVVAEGELAALTGGDTNTSLGLQRANEYLDADAIKGIENTYVLLLTDGAPYTAIQYNADGTYNPRVSGVGYDCDLTQVAANKLKGDHENTEVYTVCFGMQGKEWTATHSIDETGKLTGADKKFNIDELMTALATGEDHFFRGENVDEFELSLGSIIEETVSSGAKLWTVVDPMGAYINYEENKGEYAASFADNTLYWNLLEETPVSVVDGVYTYAMTYSITLDTEATGFEFDKWYPANEATSLTYAVIENDKLKDIKTDYFNVPTVFAPYIPEVPETPTISFNNGDASNISFMLIDAEGNVEFLYKVDIEDQTSFEIPVEAGKISAVFVKQSTSGMFWTAEEVGETALNNLIECLKANNPSYKGFDAACYGAGDHELEFKDGKFVTYTFTGAAEAGIYDIEHDSYSEPETPADPQPDDSTDSEEPVLSEKEQKKAKKQEEKAQKEKEKADKKAQKEAKKAEENSEEEIQALDAQILTLDEQIEEISEEIQVIEEEIAAE